MSNPIGMFDSGIGGLTVLKEIMRELPGEPVVYLGDTARVPYGGKSQATITRFSIENTEFLKTFDIKLLVVACHTASSLALAALKEAFELPILGVVEPGTLKAAQLTKQGRVGVIGTRATIASGAYEQALKKRDAKLKVASVACPLFVSLVEEGWTEGKLVEDIVRVYLEPLKAKAIDALILGCTHYPLLEKMIQRVMGDKVQLINPAVETALEARRVLELETQTKNGNAPQARFFVTDEPMHFKQLGEKFLGRKIENVEHCESITRS